MLLILSILAILPCSFATDTIGGYFLPSGYYGQEPGYYYYENYCPECYHYGTLELNPKGTYEGEITCSSCDADYDGTSGYDKGYNGAYGQLIRYVEPTPEPVIQENRTTEPVPLTPLEIAQNVFKMNKIL